MLELALFAGAGYLLWKLLGGTSSLTFQSNCTTADGRPGVMSHTVPACPGQAQPQLYLQNPQCMAIPNCGGTL